MRVGGTHGVMGISKGSFRRERKASSLRESEGGTKIETDQAEKNLFKGKLTS